MNPRYVLVSLLLVLVLLAVIWLLTTRRAIWYGTTGAKEPAWAAKGITQDGTVYWTATGKDGSVNTVFENAPHSLNPGEICELSPVVYPGGSVWESKCPYVPEHCEVVSHRPGWYGSHFSDAMSYAACWDGTFILEPLIWSNSYTVGVDGSLVREGNADDRFPIKLRIEHWWNKDHTAGSGFYWPAIPMPVPKELESP